MPPAAPRRGAAFVQRWVEGAARAFALAGWCPEQAGTSDGALLPLALAATSRSDALLVGGRTSGTLWLHDVRWPDDGGDGDDDGDDDEGDDSTDALHGRRVRRRLTPTLVLRDDVRRPSAVSALCAVDGGGRVAAAWLGSGESPGVLALCDARRSKRTGALKLRERATHVLHSSLWAACVSSSAPGGDCAGAAANANAAYLGTSLGAYRLDLATMTSTAMARCGSDVLAVAADAESGGAWALAGLRNGGVCVFDHRAPGRDAPAPAFRVAAAAVTGLSLLRGSPAAAVGCGLDGTLARWDLRAPSRGPIARYAGHVNAVTLGLRHVVDPAGALLAAPGHDGSVRVWSLPAAGQPLSARCAAPRPSAGAALYTAAAFELDAAAPPRLWLGAHEGLALAAPAPAERRAPGALPPNMERWTAT